MTGSLPVSAPPIERWWWVGGCVVVLGLWAASPALVVVGPILAAAGRRRALRRHRRRTARRREEAVLGWVESVARDLGTGLALGPALRARAGEYDDLPDLGAPRSGRDVLAALRARPDGSDPDRRLDLVTLALGVLLDQGGPATLGVERLAETLRARASGRALRRAHAAQAHASAVVVAAVPTGFGLLAALIEPSLARFYLHHGVGAVCVGLAASLSLVGFAWMEREIERWG